MSERVLGVGLLGCGTVGAAVVRLLGEHREDIERRAGCRLEIRSVAVRDASRDRRIDVPADRFITDPWSVLDDPDVDIVCELIGGIDPARELILGALQRGKPVVTANKEVLANAGAELFAAAENKGLDLFFEAAVGGGIPIIRPLREALAGERIRRVTGIVNGTTNYILTKMAEEGSSFGEALAGAQELGYAEADPTADIEGFDAASKLAILASIAFDSRVVAGDVYREGISSVSADDIAYAKRLGYVVKLLAIAELEEGAIAARVHPAMLPVSHPLAPVRDSFNAVFVEGEKVGELMFYGRGAGGDPTAVAVTGDLVTAARNLTSGARGPAESAFRERAVRPMDEHRGLYYLRMDVVDRPGVLAKIAAEFGVHGVSIKSVVQQGRDEDAELVFITHRAREGDLQATVRSLRNLDVVREVSAVLRVEAEEDAE